ncbi:MAG: indole-3-glycerol phosphate synthase TrpC [Gammaproteobacteria bacterium]|nr:indole-3-glycerol phosphate synthase TrpC [Gammaproteobacteria bacterium]MDH3373690.1 indole-3-glycerol phosphate synthase TrpC [Gammaproteobacteria bacterium]MDH3410806.1 indole-3-glycerol phosphate synthase TrpC [Gammaproteobacteria bacterium]MDH3551243.1 indole-3-glycerol phosphate synthase TrpC [Gammaproteobacteria bacterium]
MSDFLQTMAASSRDRVAAAKETLVVNFEMPVMPLRLGNFDIIAEIKDRSPAEGNLARGNGDRAARARSYVEGGAAAISVLTEPSHFAGSLEHLREVVAAVPDTPVMRKDFLLDPVQILEARAAGASGVLLIVAMLNDKELKGMLDCAAEHDMFVLLESFDKDDLSRTGRLLDNPDDQERVQNGQLLVGVNTRNLRTLHVDPGRLSELAPALPAARCVAESGLHDAEDAAAVATLGYRLALVGTALMRSDDPAALVATMRAAGSAELAV